MFKVNIAKCDPTKLAKVVSKNPTKTHIQKDILYLALEKDAIHKALACDKTEVKELTDTSEINELIAISNFVPSMPKWCLFSHSWIDLVQVVGIFLACPRT